MPVQANGLIQTVLMVADMLGLYQAELARILGLFCSDINKLSNQKLIFIEESHSEQQAKLLIELHQHLLNYFEEDYVKINHWLRITLPEMEKSPLLIMVDDLKLKQLVDYVKNNMTLNSSPTKISGT